MLGSTLTDLLSPWPLKIIVDHVVLNKPLPASLSLLQGLFQHGTMFASITVSLSIPLIAALSSIFAYIQLYLTSRIGYEMAYTLRRELFVHLQQLSLSYHKRARSGELLTKLAGDTSTLKDVFGDLSLSFVAQILKIIGMLAIMFTINLQLTLIILLSLPIVGIILFSLNRTVKMSARRQRRKEGEVASRISETLSSISLVQAFGRERYERERFETESTKMLHESIRTARMEAAATRSMEIVSALAVWAIVLFGAYQVLHQRMLLGDMLIFISYVQGIFKPIRGLAKLSSKFSKAGVSAERITEILAIEPDIHDAPDAISAASLRGEIIFDNVSFKYDDGTPVLRNVSFKINAGQQVAFVGASGAGKSTITSLILRFYDPCAGTILVDGVDLRSYQCDSLRQQIGMMLQDSLLFGASIRENIAYGKPDATQAEIEAAARRAYAHDFIMALPDKYETILGERGSTISGGQRQRICLARAIIRHPALLVLDEPTSAIDAESAALIQDAVKNVQHGKTTLVIAHNFRFIEHFDQILVLKEGQIVEQGTHGDLLARRGYYYDLYRMQALEETRLDETAHIPAPGKPRSSTGATAQIYPLPSERRHPQSAVAALRTAQG
jgi:ATP-binding cassette subfamily B protein/subfamily B ATP-binding cassette protein MsbA